MMLEWLGLGVGSFTQNVAPAGPENTGKTCTSISNPTLGWNVVTTKTTDLRVIPTVDKKLGVNQQNTNT
jgi:hypothetical protein